MNIIDIEFQQHVGILKLNRSITNAINRDLVNQLSGSIKKMRENPDVLSSVLTSANEKFFSIGLDIPELIELNKKEFKEFLHSFNRLCLDIFTFPKPVIAAVTGHATAGGCILALCCDYRFIAAGKKLAGLNEIKLGVPLPYPADCILRWLIGNRKARDVTDGGDFYLPAALLELGLVDKIISPPQLLPEAVKKAGSLGGLPAAGFTGIKGSRVEKVEAQVLKRLDQKEDYFVECWFSPGARERLQEAAKKF